MVAIQCVKGKPLGVSVIGRRVLPCLMMLIERGETDMQNPHKPLELNPAWLMERGCKPDAKAFTVFAVPYTSAGLPVRVYLHRTLKAAGRRLGSVIAGGLRNRADMAVFCMAPDGTIHNWYSANGKAVQ